MARLIEFNEISPELEALAEVQPRNVLELRQWLQRCYNELEKFEVGDAKSGTPNALHEHAALLVRRAMIFIRRLVDPKKADQMPWVKAKCVSHALIRFQECIQWCESQVFETSPVSRQRNGRPLNAAKELAYKSYVAASKILCADGATVTDSEVYGYLRRTFAEATGYRLPRYETWERYVRAGRDFYGTSKNSQVAGRTGRSVVRPDQI